MEPVKTFRGVMAPLDRANVDTDAIIPKQFLKSISKTGFGEGLFFDWRYLPDGKPDPDFILNAPVFRGASILVARNNFGCGSSREHAVWAVRQYGFLAVLAPYREANGTRIPAFADIFRNNCSKNGVLTVELSESDIERIFQAIGKKPGLEATVNLEAQTLTVHADPEQKFQFEVDPAVKERLLNGLDDIGITLRHEAALRAFEAAHNPRIYR